MTIFVKMIIVLKSQRKINFLISQPKTAEILELHFVNKTFVMRDVKDKFFSKEEEQKLKSKGAISYCDNNDYNPFHK